LLFTTDPGIPAWHLAVLADDRGLQLAANVTPPVRRDVIVGYGPNLVAVLNKVPALLDAGTLRAADARVELARRKSPGWWPAAGCAHRG
jgi:glycine betaine/choline ABC-type transport system substrate-binding protein